MSTARSAIALGDHHYQDRIVVFGGSHDTLHLLRLALIRSDNVLLVAADPDEAVAQHAQRMKVEHRRAPDGTEVRRAATILVADGRPEVEDAIVEDARFQCVPVFVADRPDMSDFSVLDFLDRRSCTLAGRVRTPQKVSP